MKNIILTLTLCTMLVSCSSPDEEDQCKCEVTEILLDSGMKVDETFNEYTVPCDETPDVPHHVIEDQGNNVELHVFTGCYAI